MSIRGMPESNKPPLPPAILALVNLLAEIAVEDLLAEAEAEGERGEEGPPFDTED